MKEVLRDFVYELTNIALISGVAFLIYNNKEGWGWLMFALLINIVSRKEE
jgi:hypothetical protein